VGCRNLWVIASIGVACGVEPSDAIGEEKVAAHFYARRPGFDERLDLAAPVFRLEIEPQAATTKTRAIIEIASEHEFDTEAVIRWPLPPGAAVTRGVLYVGTQRMEGAFIARDLARSVYDRIVSGRRDPMLIAWRSPQWVDITIFPLPKNGTRRFELEWIEPSAFRAKRSVYRIPAIAHEGRVIARPEVFVRGRPLLASGADIEINVKRASLATARLPGDPLGFVFARGSAPVRMAVPRVMIAAETSGIMTPRDRADQRAVIERVIRDLSPSARISLMAVDWTTKSIVDDANKDGALEALHRLDERPSAGALDIEHSLEAAIDRAQRNGARRVLFVGPGLDGFYRRDPLAGPLEKLRAREMSLSVLGPPEPRNPLADAAWISGGRAGGPSDVPLVVLDLGIHLSRPDLGGVDTWYPLRTITGEVVWLAKFAGKDYPNAVRASARELEALWARAAIGPRRGERDLGERHKVLTPLTSILALESEQDYARFGLTQHPSKWALNAGLLGLLAPQGGVSNVFGPGGLGTGINNAMGGLRGSEMGDAGGAGGLGTRGTGASGGGNSLGIGGLGTHGGRGTGGYGNIDLGGRGKGMTRIVPGRTIIQGSLTKEEIGRVIRRNLARFKYCYEKQLNANPNLQGKISVYFSIAPTGAVAQASVRETSMNDQNVESCVLTVMRSLKFPKPWGGGIAVVTYPFVFATDAMERPIDRALQRWSEAHDAFARFGSSKVAALLAAPSHLEREALAWWLVENELRQSYVPCIAAQLVAELLVESHDTANAERLLSERALDCGMDVDAMLRRIGASEGANRVVRLTQRPSLDWSLSH
jgi:hypothetical protein